MKSILEIQAVLTVLYVKAGMSKHEALTEVKILGENRDSLAEMLFWTYENKPKPDDIMLKTESILEREEPNKE